MEQRGAGAIDGDISREWREWIGQIKRAAAGKINSIRPAVGGMDRRKVTGVDDDVTRGVGQNVVGTIGAERKVIRERQRVLGLVVDEMNRPWSTRAKSQIVNGCRHPIGQPVQWIRPTKISSSSIPTNRRRVRARRG